VCSFTSRRCSCALGDPTWYWWKLEADHHWGRKSNEYQLDWSIATFISNILHHRKSLLNCQFRWTSRSCNSAAHVAAKFPLSLVGPFVSISVVSLRSLMMLEWWLLIVLLLNEITVIKEKICALIITHSTFSKTNSISF